MRAVSAGGDDDVRQQRGGALGPAILLARLQFGTVLAVGLVAAVALGLWAAAPPFLDHAGNGPRRSSRDDQDHGPVRRGPRDRPTLARPAVAAEWSDLHAGRATGEAAREPGRYLRRGRGQPVPGRSEADPSRKRATG